MNRPVLALLLLLAPALAPAAETSPSLDVRPRVADAHEVVVGFADLCIFSRDDEEQRANLLKRNGKPVRNPPPAPAGAPPATHYDLEIQDVQGMVSFSDALCMFGIRSVDLPATAAEFDGFVAAVYGDMPQVDLRAETEPPPSGRIVRSLHLASPGAKFGMRLMLIADDNADGTASVHFFRGFEDADPRARPVADAPAGPPPGGDAVPREDVAGRTNFPPVFPEAAVKACAFGVSKVRVSIDDKGNVLDVRIQESSRNRDLDRAAMDAARQWRFQPGMKDGQAFGGDIIVPVNFQDPCPKDADEAT